MSSCPAAWCTRVAQDDHVRTLSIQSGAASKDVWVGGEGPCRYASASLEAAGRALDIKRIGEAPPSRAMDNLFWLGRYTERAEGLVRVLRAITARLGDDPLAAADGAERFLLPFGQSNALANTAAIREALAGDDAKLREELRSVLYGRKSPDDLSRVFERVRQTAWSARDRLSLDTWRTIHILTEEQPEPDTDGFDIPQALTMLDALVRRAAAFSGLCAENMTRGPNWLRSSDLGRRIERRRRSSILVGEPAVAPAGADSDAARVRMMLEIADSAMTYRSRYLNQFDVAGFDRPFPARRNRPRAVAFQLTSLEQNLRQLPLITPEQRSGSALTRRRRRPDSVVNRRQRASMFAEVSDSGKRLALARLTDKIENAMTHLNNAIADAYFQHPQRRRIGATQAREAL